VYVVTCVTAMYCSNVVVLAHCECHMCHSNFLCEALVLEYALSAAYTDFICTGTADAAAAAAAAVGTGCRTDSYNSVCILAGALHCYGAVGQRCVFMHADTATYLHIYIYTYSVAMYIYRHNACIAFQCPRY
jgi:hypothetical protein